MLPTWSLQGYKIGVLVLLLSHTLALVASRDLGLHDEIVQKIRETNTLLVLRCMHHGTLCRSTSPQCHLVKGQQAKFHKFSFMYPAVGSCPIKNAAEFLHFSYLQTSYYLLYHCCCRPLEMLYLLLLTAVSLIHCIYYQSFKCFPDMK
jgi:hypothetical protein